MRFGRLPSGEALRELRAVYRDMEAHGVGTVEQPMNFFSGMALRPDLLRPGWELAKAHFLKPRLAPSLVQLAYVAISVRNRADYCCIVHLRTLRVMGVDEAVIDSVTGDPELRGVPSPQREMILFALKVSADPNALQEGDFRRLRELGMPDEEILELVLLAAYANWANTWARAADLMADPG